MIMQNIKMQMESILHLVIDENLIRWQKVL